MENSIEDELKKMDDIFIKYLPKHHYYDYEKPCNVFDWLQLGNLLDALKLQTDAVVSVLNNTDHFIDEFSSKIWLPIKAFDDRDQDISQHFNRVFKFLDNMEKENKKCIIHCQAGVNRSATIVLAYYIHKTNTDLFDAYEYLSSMRPGIIYNNGFRKQLINWYKSRNL
jgi:protein-tyrosine phosphatase